MEYTNTYTSTGSKFIKKCIKDSSLLLYPRPISLQLALTEKCNLKCSFCSVANREKKYEFGFNELIDATTAFIKQGINTIEITGGGEPLMYVNFDEYVKWLSKYYAQIRLGLITNGTMMGDYSNTILDKFDWIRVSLNSLDYCDSVVIPKIRGTLGYSYCYGPDSSIETLERIARMARENGADYVRVVPNCCCSSEDLEVQHNEIEPIVERIGQPLFYQKKQFKRPSNCYWGYYKPFLYCDGYIFPCSSTVLNDDAGKKFNEKYRIYHWTQLEDMYSKRESLVDTNMCNHCVFAGQNEIIGSLIESGKHEDFI